MKPYKPVADPHLQIRGEPGHPDPEITGEGGGGGQRSQKKNVSALWASVWSNNWGGGGVGGAAPPLDP